MFMSTFWVIRFCIIVAWHTVALHLWTFGAEKREKDYIANGGRSGEQHGETIDTDADTASRRQSEGEGANVVFVHAVGLFVTTLTLAELQFEAAALLLGIIQFAEAIGNFHAAGKDFETLNPFRLIGFIFG